MLVRSLIRMRVTKPRKEFALDLVVELDSFVDKIRSVKPWIIRKVEKDAADACQELKPAHKT